MGVLCPPLELELDPVIELNLGCGRLVHPGAVNVDHVALPGVDVVHDLDVTPWPLPTAHFDQITAAQIFEHLSNPVGFMVECHRVLKPGGLLWLSVPHWQSENSFTDPTHVRHCTERTWDYWCAGTTLHAQFGAAYGDVTFEKRSVARVADDIHVELIR